MNIIVDESKIMEASVLIERAKVLSNTLVNGYFGQTIESPKDFWKLTGFYYDGARVIMETVLSLVHDAEQLLDVTSEEAVVAGGHEEWLINSNILMEGSLPETRAQVIIYAHLNLLMVVGKGYTYMFGNIIMVLFLLAIMFITLMKIKVTIILKI